MISVIVPTNRIGGLDVLFDSLAQQTYRNFELIVVDAIRNWRVSRELGIANGNKYFGAAGSVRYILTKPRSDPFPRVAYCEAVNSGIAHARGDVILLACDFTWFRPDCLETHAALQAQHRAPVMLDYDYRALPPLAPAFEPYAQKLHASDDGYADELNATTARYCADLASGKLNPLMWSIFEKPLTDDTVSALDITHKHLPCSVRELNDWNWCSFKNESFPTELFLDMNGLDEAYDESHCYQDQEFSYRLRERGIKWVSGPPGTGMVSVIDPRPVLNVKQLKKPISWNKALCEDIRVASKRLPVNPEFNLREERARLLA